MLKRIHSTYLYCTSAATETSSVIFNSVAVEVLSAGELQKQLYFSQDALAPLPMAVQWLLSHLCHTLWRQKTKYVKILVILLQNQLIWIHFISLHHWKIMTYLRRTFFNPNNSETKTWDVIFSCLRSTFSEIFKRKRLTGRKKNLTPGNKDRQKSAGHTWRTSADDEIHRGFLSGWLCIWNWTQMKKKKTKLYVDHETHTQKSVAWTLTLYTNIWGT